ncbi:MAG: hypothetical protein Fur0021_38450 [Candidatus Promineifilaceae bacterium]
MALVDEIRTKFIREEFEFSKHAKESSLRALRLRGEFSNYGRKCAVKKSVMAL